MTIDPFNDETHVTLGNLYYSLGRHEEAAKEYKAAVKIYPSATSYYSLGQAYPRTGTIQSGRGAVQHSQPVGPPNTAAGDFGIGLVRSREENALTMRS